LYIQLKADDYVTAIFAKKAYLHTGWAEDVRFKIADGNLESIEIDSTVSADDFSASLVIPGLANAHSHAFQRALTGHTEKRGPSDRDTFWSWRTQMYRLAGVIDADALVVIARQAYSEMMASGYTAVAEFHYLHGKQNGGGKIGAMSEAILTAAADTGIRLTYLPILYERAGFDDPEPTHEQRRFVMTPDEFVDHYEIARQTAGPNVTVGVGAHSLRAVTRLSLRGLVDLASRDECPMHIHIAEQTAEVEQCIARHNARPVEWLLKEFSPNENWCLVHATHSTDEELRLLSESQAVVCLCPSTEANLGDGLFPLRVWLDRGGRMAIGSDSQITINPFEELRWLEYGQRLHTRSRNVAALNGSHTGKNLFSQALEGGQRACGHDAGGLRVGGPADLVTLDDGSPMLAGHDTRSTFDALVFSGGRSPLDRVMVAGEWRVIDGEHVNYPQLKTDYLAVIRDLWAETGSSL
jgi:formimidoylglutamate deiminase